jgi:hypothetical protein
VGYALTVAAMLYSHYYGFFVLAAHAAFVLSRRTPAAGRTSWLRSLAGAAVLMAVWVPSLIAQLAAGRAWPSFRVPLTGALLVDTLSAMTVGQPLLQPGALRLPTSPASGSAWLAAAAFIGALAVTSVAVRRRAVNADAFRLLLCAAVVPPVLAFVVSLGLNVYAPRYLLFIVSPIALLLAAAVLGPGLGRIGIAAACLVVAANLAGTIAFYRQPSLDVFDWRYVAHELAVATRADDAIVFLPGFSRIPIDYYFPGPQPRIPLTPDGDDVVGPGGARMPEVASTLLAHPRVWIVTVHPVPSAVPAFIRAMTARSFVVAHRARLTYVEFFRLERRP